MVDLAIFFVTAIGALSIFTNGVLLAILLTDPLHYFKSSTTYFIISLTVADLLTGANSCLLGVHHFRPFSRQFTSYLLSLFWITIQASFLTLLAMSVERFLIVKYPFSCRSWITKRRVCTSIVCIWLISTLLGSLILLPEAQALYVQFSIYTEFFISVFFIAGLYTFILLSVKRSQKTLGKAGNFHRGGSQYGMRNRVPTRGHVKPGPQVSMQPLSSSGLAKTGDQSEGEETALNSQLPHTGSANKLAVNKPQAEYRQVKISTSDVSDDVSYTLLSKNSEDETVDASGNTEAEGTGQSQNGTSKQVNQLRNGGEGTPTNGRAYNDGFKSPTRGGRIRRDEKSDQSSLNHELPPERLKSSALTLSKQPSMSTIQENKLTAVVLLLVGVLVVTVLPYLLVAQIYVGYSIFFKNREPPESFTKFLSIYFPIELLNFAVNPFIYAWRLPQYRRTLAYLLSPRKSKFQRGNSIYNRTRTSGRARKD